ncbi:MAG: lysophospholipid acyltransferase family protein [Candidatus Omnitrophica bacterium]|nr:lysophospholipid acyltransferase family protein [Candidatus Omnitrophota bacterium]MBU1038106.1 lysophospholipid acyltransferase family protein [Candidatus Omnitrophota bacterium]
MKFKFRRYYLYYWGRCLAFILYLVPLSVALATAGLLGRIAFRVVGKYRKLTVDNLRFAFPEKSQREINSIAVKVFENLGKTAVEFVNFPKINKSNLDRFVRVENIGLLDDELKKGKGVIILTAHFGNWEMLALTIKVKEYPGSVVGRRLYFHKYDRYLNYLRRINNVNVIYRDQSPRNILKVLKAGGIIGMLADQDVDSVEGVFVDFFGKPAYTPVGPAALAMASGAAILPAFIIRRAGRHILMIDKPIEIANTGDREADLLANTRRWSDVVESYIKRYPDQWVWMHRRWKTRPSLLSHSVG